jgi:hypothetical protein
VYVTLVILVHQVIVKHVMWVRIVRSWGHNHVHHVPQVQQRLQQVPLLVVIVLKSAQRVSSSIRSLSHVTHVLRVHTPLHRVLIHPVYHVVIIKPPQAHKTQVLTVNVGYYPITTTPVCIPCLQDAYKDGIGNIACTSCGNTVWVNLV